MNNTSDCLKKIFTGQPEIYWLCLSAGFAYLIAVIPYWLGRPGVETYVELSRLKQSPIAAPLFIASAVAWLCALVITPPENKPLRRLTGALFALFLLAAWPMIQLCGLQIGISLIAFVFLYFDILPKFILSGAILLILFVSAIMSLLEASTRSPVSRVRADHRTMATAIEAYYLDYNAYPPHTNDYSHALWQSPVRMPTFYSGRAGSLTTPIGYITSYFMEDNFRLLGETRTFAYYTRGPNWILISAGPNCRFELQPDILESILTTQTLIEKKLISYTYDPSNGTDSPGDVWRIKQ